MDRAVGFGLHAKATLTLLDRDRTPLNKLAYQLTESRELAKAFVKLNESDAREFDSKVRRRAS